MTNLHEPTLGTNSSVSPVSHAIHLAGAHLLKEFFRASDYRECIASSEHKNNEVGKWAHEMRAHDYHELHTLLFVGMWAAFEAGIEDTVAAVIRRDRTTATQVAAQFKRKPYSLSTWPWPESICTEISQKLDQNALNAIRDAGGNGLDLFARIQTIFRWVDIVVDDDPSVSQRIAETSMIRNIIVHRYGRINDEDAKKMPSLSPWIGKVMPIDRAKFTAYYQAIADCLIAIGNALAKSRHAGT